MADGLSMDCEKREGSRVALAVLAWTTIGVELGLYGALERNTGWSGSSRNIRRSVLDMLCSDGIQIEMHTRLSPGEKSGQHVNGNIYPFLKGLPIPGFRKVDACPQNVPAPGNHWQLWFGVSIYGWGCCQGIMWERRPGHWKICLLRDNATNHNNSIYWAVKVPQKKKMPQTYVCLITLCVLNHLILRITLRGRCDYHPHFTDEETEVLQSY